MLTKILSIIKHTLRDRRLWAYLMASLLFFSIFMKMDFATDTYADIMTAPSETIAIFLRGGRPFTAFATLVFTIFGVGIRLINFLSFLLAIFSLTLALYLLERLVRKHITSSLIWASLLSILLILNPFIIEYFMFVEKGIMLLGILFCIVALYFYVNFLAQSTRRSLVLAFAFGILAVFCYQGTLGLFIVLATIFTIKQSPNFKAFVKNTLISVAIYATGVIVDFVLIKCMTSGGRTGGEIILSESIQKICASFHGLFVTFSILPAWLLPAALIAIITIWLVSRLVRGQLFTLQSAQTVAIFAYLLLVVILATIAPQLAQSTAAIWVVPRTAYVFASLPGIFLAIVLFSSTKPAELPRPANYALLLVGAILLLVQFYRFNTISVNHYESTAIDRYRSEQLAGLIAQYEAKSQTKVTEVMLAFDFSPSATYPGIFQAGDFNISSYITDWSDVNSLNYWTHNNFTRQSPTESWQVYCNTHDWDTFSFDQINFSGATLQICIY